MVYSCPERLSDVHGSQRRERESASAGAKRERVTREEFVKKCQATVHFSRQLK